VGSLFKRHPGRVSVERGSTRAPAHPGPVHRRVWRSDWRRGCAGGVWRFACRRRLADRRERGRSLRLAGVCSSVTRTFRDHVPMRGCRHAGESSQADVPSLRARQCEVLASPADEEACGRALDGSTGSSPLLCISSCRWRLPALPRIRAHAAAAAELADGAAIAPTAGESSIWSPAPIQLGHWLRSIGERTTTGSDGQAGTAHRGGVTPTVALLRWGASPLRGPMVSICCPPLVNN
jgi:hypothetical protein